MEFSSKKINQKNRLCCFTIAQITETHFAKESDLLIFPAVKKSRKIRFQRKIFHSVHSVTRMMTILEIILSKNITLNQ